jgi:hypothetical protein
MNPEQFQPIAYVLLVCCFLVLYMFLAMQFWFVMLKHDVRLSDVLFRFKFQGVVNLLLVKKNPEDYVKARWFLFGALAFGLLPFFIRW